MKTSKLAASGLVSLLIVAACATPGEESRPDTFDQSQLNTAQQTQVVTIISAMPAKAYVKNQTNHDTSRIIGGLLGAALGAGLTGGVAHSAVGAGLAGAAGGVAGAYLGGQVIRDRTTVQSVLVTYRDPKSGATLASTQVGRLCEYAPGNAMLVHTARGETRVQPNARCSKKG